MQQAGKRRFKTDHSIFFEKFLPPSFDGIMLEFQEPYQTISKKLHKTTSAKNLMEKIVYRYFVDF